jgi:Ca2+/Na+ antiporter
MECIWCQFFVPNLVADEVQRVSTILNDTIVHLCTPNIKDDQVIVLDATEYLYISTNLAKKYYMMESILILSYHSYLPGELAKKWQSGVTSRIHRHNNHVHQSTLFITGLILLQSMAMFPFIFHQMFIRFSQPFLLFGLVYLGTLIVENVLYTSLVATASFLILLYLSYIYFFKKSKQSTPVISPLDVSDDRHEKITAIHPAETEDIIIVDYDKMVYKDDSSTKEKENDEIKLNQECQIIMQEIRILLNQGIR